MEKSLTEMIADLVTYKVGDFWAVWADEKRRVRLCRYDGGGVWATGDGHMDEAMLRERGWIRVPQPQ